MIPTQRLALWLLTSCLIVGVIAVGGFAPTSSSVSANHGAEDADFMVEPLDNPRPGATNVEYGQIVVGQAGGNFQTLEEMEAVYEAGRWTSCGPGDADVFGIDRGNTYDSYEIDESLEENTKSFSAGDDVFHLEFYREEDLGESTSLNSGDAVVSVTQCIDNPDEPGWYQIAGSVTGVTDSGERRTIGSDSHYFWICDCEDEADARNQLGPPPSESDPNTPTPTTPTATNTNTNTDTNTATATDTSDTPTGTTGETNTSPQEDVSTEDTQTNAAPRTPTSEPATTDTPSGESEAATDESVGADESGNDDWESHVIETPTPGDGAGFGVPVALLSLVTLAVFLRRRDP